MFCTSCGKPIDDDSKFCPFCGATVANDKSEMKEESVPTFTAPTEENVPVFTAPTEESVPTFTAPVEEIPTFNAPGTSENVANNDVEIPTFKAPSDDIPTFTAPPKPHFNGPACHYHSDEPAVGRCARCGKPLCQDCCDSYGVSSGQYEGKHLCYDCTQELVAENVAELNANLNKIKGQFILQIIGMVIGFIYGMSAGVSSGDIGGGFVAGLVCACIGGVFLSAVKAFFSLAWECIKIAFAGQFGWLTILSIIFNLCVIVVKCIWATVTQTIQYIIYIKKTSGFIESDSKFLEQIKEYMEYTMIRQQNRGVDLETLMQEGSQLYNNSFAQMVRDQGEERAEAYMSQCVTRIAENGEIIRDFPNAA